MLSQQHRADTAQSQQTLRDINMDISMIQSAEASLAAMSESVGRMTTLASQAKGGLYSQSQISELQSEINGLTTEINDFTADFIFNGKTLSNAISHHKSLGNLEFTLKAVSLDRPPALEAALKSYKEVAERIRESREKLGATATSLREELVSTEEEMTALQFARANMNAEAAAETVKGLSAMLAQSKALNKEVQNDLVGDIEGTPHIQNLLLGR